MNEKRKTHGAMAIHQIFEIDEKIGDLYQNGEPAIVSERSVGTAIAKLMARRMANGGNAHIGDIAHVQQLMQCGIPKTTAKRIIKKARVLSNEINMIPMASAEPDTSSTDLINIRTQAIDDTTVQTVNARDLHAFLEVGKDFSTWIKGRIEQFEFVENQDFVIFDSAPQNGGAGNRGLRVEYHLTLDMAKELSMVERTAKGKEARQYFIECEQLLKAGGAAPKAKPGPKHEKAAAIIITTESLEQFAAQVKTTAALGLSASVSKRLIRPLLVDIIAPEMAAHPNTRNEAYIQDVQRVGVSLRTAQRIVVAARKKSHEISANTVLTADHGESDEK